MALIYLMMKFGGEEEVIDSSIDGVAAIVPPFIKAAALATPKRTDIHGIKIKLHSLDDITDKEDDREDKSDENESL